MNDYNQKLLEWSEQFNTYHLPRWDELPAIEYYMDQVIEYINSYVKIFSDDGNSNLLTAAMINNYVKLGLIPAPVKKKYSKIHISNLIVITIIKQVCVISQIKEAILLQMKSNGGRGAYNIFCAEIEKSVISISSIVKNGRIYVDEPVALDNMAVKNISQALSSKILAIKVIELLKKTEEN
ncbi:MAG: DUF1836 domain-containing protein [Clostridia bacterium]